MKIQGKIILLSLIFLVTALPPTPPARAAFLPILRVRGGSAAVTTVTGFPHAGVPPTRARLPRVASLATSWPTTPTRKIDATCAKQREIRKRPKKVQISK